jgi:hypothetical protein
LAIGNPIFLDDDVRYCSDSLVKTHYIVIRVDGATPYDRPYLCSTPGICDTKEKLWLAGAYYYQRLRSPGGGILQSFPKTISNWISPDFVVQQGDSLAGIPKNRKPATTGVFGKTGQAKTYEYCTFNNGQIDNCSGDFDYISDVNVYGVFLRGKRTNPVTVVGVVPRNSEAVSDWNSVPQAYKQDTAPETVLERRAYLLELVKSAKQ